MPPAPIRLHLGLDHLIDPLLLVAAPARPDRNYALLYSDMGEFALRTTMDAIERRLDPAEFARVSRSAIVRIAAIREVRLGEKHNHILILHTGEEISCSRKFWCAALNRLL